MEPDSYALQLTGSVVNISLKTLFLFLSFAVVTTGAEINAKALYVRARPSIVLLMTFDGNDRPLALGTGFVIADGTRIATNFHVLAGASKVRLKTSDGTVAEIKSIVGFDTSKDLAVVVSPIKLTPIALAPKKPEIGDSVLAIGNAKGFEASISIGLISGIRDFKGGILYQISAPISHGSSGGPILNSAGEAVGIATLMIANAQNINFCIPTTYLQPLLARKTVTPLEQLRTPKASVISRTEPEDFTTMAQKLREKSLNEIKQRLPKPDNIDSPIQHIRGFDLK